MRWYENHRMEWIAEMLRIYGFINRRHLISKFEISVPQAAKDFREFQKTRPGLMTYDKKAKAYVATNKEGRNGNEG